MARALACLGDKTSYGEIISATASWFEGNKAINLTLRTRIKRLARKTICFSRSVEIHEKVIGAFIEKHMFY